jgi:hypothetical protein
MKSIFVALVFMLMCLPSLALAQLSTDFGGTGQSLTVTLNPAYPAPGETVTASIDDYALGAAFSTITWLVDGKENTTLRNNRSFTFTAGALGEVTTITGRLTLPGGTTLEAKSSITPLYTDIIIEPQTYTPQTYLGRALPTVGSLIRATALVTGANGALPPQSYSYLWKLNGTTIGGGGRNGAFQISYTTPNDKNHTLSVEVYDVRGLLVTRRGVNVRTGDVDLRLYEVSALYGLQTTVAPASTQFIGNTLTLRSVPYNLDLRSTPANTFSEWRVANSIVQNETGNPYEITLERTGQGQSVVDFKLRHRELLLQGGEVRTVLNF